MNKNLRPMISIGQTAKAVKVAWFCTTKAMMRLGKSQKSLVGRRLSGGNGGVLAICLESEKQLKIMG